MKTTDSILSYAHSVIVPYINMQTHIILNDLLYNRWVKILRQIPCPATVFIENHFTDLFLHIKPQIH
jgi:hypothetical protein